MERGWGIKEQRLKGPLMQTPLVSVGMLLRVGCWRGCGARRHPPHMPADRCGSSRRTKPALLLWRCQMWNCVNRVTWRPFLPSDLYQKGLFLETATSDCALGKKANHTLLLFLNISVHLGLCSKMYVKKKRTIPDLSSWKSEFWILLVRPDQEEAWS